MSEYEFMDSEGSGRTAAAARLVHLKRYIDSLTVKPNGPLEVLRAVGFDLIYVGERYAGNLSRAAGLSGKREAPQKGRGAGESS